jgi:hypothetical protein
MLHSTLSTTQTLLVGLEAPIRMRPTAATKPMCSIISTTWLKPRPSKVLPPPGLQHRPRLRRASRHPHRLLLLPPLLLPRLRAVRPEPAHMVP